jgi:2-amino-4-hydroxy-6-hydroxymethyldihydropteridine diphosphokinase
VSPVAYIGFGANLGETLSTLEKAVLALSVTPEILVKRCSQLYETEPVGVIDEAPKFLNAVISVETRLTPGQLIGEMRKIEQALGKSPNHRSDASRIIDLDLLLYGEDEFHEEGLEIPHPRMARRAFVLVPLAELAEDAFVPVPGCSVGELLRRLPAAELEGVRVVNSDGRLSA